MPSAKSPHSLLMILGPTAVGKTDLAFYLALKRQAGILNCDSVQMFKELNIGSAKKTRFTEQEKKIPLFLFNTWQAPFVCSAGLFRKKALTILKQELPLRPMIAAGGSGFYIQALDKGMHPVKKVHKNIPYLVNEMLAKQGLKKLYHLLQKWDPEYSSKISPNDRYRIVRSLCLLLSEMKSLSAIQKEFKIQRLPYPLTKIGLFMPRKHLLKKIQNRTEQMLKEGLREEVQALLNLGLKDWPLMNSPGYKECSLALQGLLPVKDLCTAIVHRTMQLAKKQMTWFKRDKEILWYNSAEQSLEAIYKDLTAQQLFKAENTPLPD